MKLTVKDLNIWLECTWLLYAESKPHHLEMKINGKGLIIIVKDYCIVYNGFSTKRAVEVYNSLIKEDVLISVRVISKKDKTYICYIKAIKASRQILNIGLKEAKDFIDGNILSIKEKNMENLHDSLFVYGYDVIREENETNSK